MTAVPTPANSVWRQVADDLRRNPITLSLLLACATALLYLPVAHHAYLDFDDIKYVGENNHVGTGLRASNLIWAFKDINTFYWHPVTWISHMLDCQIFGLNPGAHHLVNVAFHIANALLLFYILRIGTRAVWRSFMVAALFAFHPLNTETVAWLAERKSLLSAFFSLLTVVAYMRYTKHPGWRGYLPVVILFAAALMSKPMAVTLPVMLLLFDLWPLERYKDLPFARRWSRLTIEKLPLFAMSAASSVVTVIGHRYAMASVNAVPISDRIQTAIVCYGTYLVKLFWPAGLVAFYPLRTPSHVTIAGWILLLLGISGLVVRFRRTEYLVMGWLLFVVALVPVSGLIQVGSVARADRFTYVPGIGIFILVIWGCGDLVQRWHIPQPVPSIVLLVALLACAGATRYYLQFWRDGVTLFTRVRSLEPADPMIELYLGDALVSGGRPDDAFVHYQESCRLNARGDLCHYNSAEYLFSHYRLSEAVAQYQMAAELTNNPAVETSSLVNAADALISLADYSSAATLLNRALRLDPANQKARQLLLGLPH